MPSRLLSKLANVRGQRLYHTIRHLKFGQIYGRVSRSFIRPRPKLGLAPQLRKQRNDWVRPISREPKLVSQTRIRLLNQDGHIEQPYQWNDLTKPKLWLYNLHYFDDLKAVVDAEHLRWQKVLIDRWIAENPPGFGNGWEPYTISLRVVNWIKWVLDGHEIEPEWQNSLAVQVRWLEDSIEWHLLGNHLLSNAKALVLAGLFFEGDEARQWLNKGLDIYENQLSEQVLDDGGHFELSPMYHNIILEDLLDLANAFCTFGEEKNPIASLLPDLAVRMLRWMDVMCHPDGEIAFFNDAAFGIAADPCAIRGYSGRLGLSALGPETRVVSHLPTSGYVRIERGDAVAMADVAAVGPDYLPGHAHADTLSFELSLGRERVIVNGGTSVYGTSDQRQKERSTAAHSTVEIDGENSSEVWGGFRVARRARVYDVAVSDNGNDVSVFALHDGYRRLSGKPVHRRAWRMMSTGLLIEDRIDGCYKKAIARFHLGSEVKLMIDDDGKSGNIELSSGRKINWYADAVAAYQASEWHPEFGKSLATQALVIPILDGRLQTEFCWAL